MNKILCNTTDELNTACSTLEIQNEKTVLKIKNDVKIDHLVFPNFPFHSTWILDNDATLTIHTVLSLENIEGTIEIISTDHTKVSLHLGIHSIKENHFTLKNVVEKNHNISDIKVRVLGEEKSHMVLKTSGVLKKDTFENEFLEDVKYLNEEDRYIECIPELIVDSNEVVANHLVTIGGISIEELFYLLSKGMDEKTSKELIRKCFISQMEK